MTAIHRKFGLLLLATVTLGTWILPAASIRAQQKPVLIVSINGIDALLSDIGYVAQTAGVGDYGQMAAMMTQPYTQGVDKSRPIGLMVTVHGEQFRPLAFVPVKDFNTLRMTLEPQLGPPREVGGGVLQFSGPVPIFVRHNKGWAFVAKDAESLKALPEDPASQLEGLQRQYDVAIRARVASIPEAYRQMAMMQMKQGLQSQIRRQPGESDAQFEIRKNLVQNQVQQWETLLNEIDQMTVGFNIDQQSKNAYLEMSMTALQGTKTARQMEMLTDTKSGYSGLLAPDSAVTMNMAYQIPQEEIQQAVSMINTLRERAKLAIEDDENLRTPERRQAAKDLVDDLFHVVTQTIQSGRVDSAAAVTLGPERLTAVFASRVADGSQLESILKKLVAQAKADDPDFPSVQFNADKHAGVRFHKMSIPIPQGEEARKVFGDRLELSVGIGKSSVYVAVGRDGLPQLKKAIDRSASSSNTVVPPFQMKIALGQILRFASTVDENPTLDALATALQQSGGKDHIFILGKPVNQGVTYRFQVEEGVLRAIGQAAGRTAPVRAEGGF